MGGPGSGRWPAKASVAEARLLDIGELCDGGRAHTHPHGSITWLARGSPCAALTYTITRDYSIWFILDLRYRPLFPLPLERPQHFSLKLEPARRPLAFCPACYRAVRKLYVPRSGDYFLCRSCHGLLYRGPSKRKETNQALAQMQEAIAPLIAGLPPWQESKKSAAAKRREREQLLAQLEAEQPLFREEEVVYSLRLSALGLSCRQIAAVMGCSKSSVQRYLTGGFWGLDLTALARDRRDRIPSPFAVPLGERPREWRAFLRAVKPELGKAARYWRTHKVPEEQVLRALGPEEELEGW